MRTGRTPSCATTSSTRSRPWADSPYWDPAAIAERGRDAVATLAPGPAAVGSVQDSARLTLDLLADSAPDRTLGSPVGTMPVVDYLPSRVAELVIHGLDLLDALTPHLSAQTVAPQPSTLALETALTFVASRAAHRDGDLVLRALTGRGDLPPGYSVY